MNAPRNNGPGTTHPTDDAPKGPALPLRRPLDLSSDFVPVTGERCIRTKLFGCVVYIPESLAD